MIKFVTQKRWKKFDQRRSCVETVDDSRLKIFTESFLIEFLKGIALIVFRDFNFGTNG